jgi:hypothetical protein
MTKIRKQITKIWEQKFQISRNKNFKNRGTKVKKYGNKNTGTKS